MIFFTKDYWERNYVTIVIVALVFMWIADWLSIGEVWLGLIALLLVVIINKLDKILEKM